MNKLQVIHEQEVLGNEFKVYGTKEEPLFLAKDVAKWIGHTNTAKMLDSVDEDEKIKAHAHITIGYREAYFLTEHGVYEVLMQSRKPIAKQFKKQVKNILKTIRENGAYMTPQTIEKVLTNPDFIIELATKLKVEQKKTNKLEKELKAAQPKIVGFDNIVNSDGLIGIRDFAKHFNLGPNRFFETLRELNFLYRSNGCNVPKEGFYRDCFRVKRKTIKNGDVKMVTFIVPNKAEKLIKKLIKEGVISSEKAS